MFTRYNVKRSLSRRRKLLIQIAAIGLSLAGVLVGSIYLAGLTI